MGKADVFIFHVMFFINLRGCAYAFIWQLCINKKWGFERKASASSLILQKDDSNS